MKQKLIIIFFQIAISSLVFAQERSIAEVLDIFDDLYIKELKQEVINDKNLSIEPLTKDGKIYMYVVNNNNSGWAIISNEKKYHTIIGFLGQGHFDTDTTQMPCGLKLLLQHHINMIDSLRRDGLTQFYSRINSTKKAESKTIATMSYTLGDCLLKKMG